MIPHDTIQDALARNGDALRTATGGARRELLRERGVLKAATLGIPAGLGAKNFAKGLAQGTQPEYAAGMETEVWAEIQGIPELRRYEVSNYGRVRKWMTKGGKSGPRTYKGCAEGDTVVYRLRGTRYTIDELMRLAFGDDADEMESGYDPRDRDRELTQYERSEIVLAEGLKPAFAVAEDFRIDASRVRNIWDGLE